MTEVQMQNVRNMQIFCNSWSQYSFNLHFSGMRELGMREFVLATAGFRSKSKSLTNILGLFEVPIHIVG